MKSVWNSFESLSLSERLELLVLQGEQIAEAKLSDDHRGQLVLLWGRLLEIQFTLRSGCFSECLVTNLSPIDSAADLQPYLSSLPSFGKDYFEGLNRLSH